MINIIYYYTRDRQYGENLEWRVFMKTVAYVLLLLASFSSYATITIGNFHEVDQESSLYRGREPKTKVSQLAEIGITDVVIFKNDVRGEVYKEITALEELEINSHHIPFKWKEYPSVELACEQLIEAMTIMRDVRAAGGKVFFHCTAGEDRTGALAGLFRMLDEGLDRETVFEEEMCARGYSDGSSHKPWVVTSAIQKELTPIFIAIAKLIEQGELRLDSLDSRVCSRLKVYPTRLKCKN